MLRTERHMTPTMQSNETLQLVKVKNSEQQIELDVEFTSGKVSLMQGKEEVGYVTYEPIGQGIIGQEYIWVDGKYKRQGLSIILSSLCAKANENAKIIYLKGGSLTPKGSALAKALGFKTYDPNKDEKVPLLDIAYKRQREDSGLTKDDTETIPPILWMSRSELESTMNEKIVTSGWQIGD
jgi:hypothetical protein